MIADEHRSYTPAVNVRMATTVSLQRYRHSNRSIVRGRVLTARCQELTGLEWRGTSRAMSLAHRSISSSCLRNPAGPKGVD